MTRTRPGRHSFSPHSPLVKRRAALSASRNYRGWRGEPVLSRCLELRRSFCYATPRPPDQPLVDLSIRRVRRACMPHHAITVVSTITTNLADAIEVQSRARLRITHDAQSSTSRPGKNPSMRNHNFSYFLIHDRWQIWISQDRESTSVGNEGTKG